MLNSFSKSLRSITSKTPRTYTLSGISRASFYSTSSSSIKGSADIGAIEQEGDGKVKITIKPIPRDNEDIEKKRKRLIYQSRKRGILETDLLLSRFLNRYIDELSLEELIEYDQLLDEADWDIFYWATRNFDVTPLPSKWENSSILARLQEMSENKDREVLRMPELP